LTLTKRTGDAIRVLVHLAAQPPGTRALSADLAHACGVSAGNMPTMVAKLGRFGLLESTPGRGGGCRLARPPEMITLAEVVEALEGSLELDRCSIDDRRCAEREFHCGMHRTWRDTHASLIANLSGLTLAEVVRREASNRQRSGQGPSAPGSGRDR
jgi:Rrf2 family protein